MPTTARAGTGLGAALAGTALIAATYGMARFGVGLFAPTLAAERPRLTPVLGWAAAAQFLSYCLAAVIAGRVVDRRPRAGLLLAGVSATAGCLGVALAPSPALFVAAVFLGGMGGGFASPALVPVIDAVVARAARATAQSAVNSGTALGVIGAGLVAFAASSAGPAWVAMALVCAGAAAWTWWPVRGGTRPLALGATSSSGRVTSRRLPAGGRRLLMLPAGAAILAGAGSALIWTFGPLLATEAGVVAREEAGWLWIALGLGGLLGPLTGALVARAGLRGGWLSCALTLALAAGGLALATGTEWTWAAYASMGLFGAGYMGLSGVLILWARRGWPAHAGAGTSVLFIALAIGQALGSAGFGQAHPHANPASLAGVAGALCVAGGLMPFLRGAPDAAS